MVFRNYQLVQLIQSIITLTHFAVLKRGLFAIYLCTEMDNMAITRPVVWSEALVCATGC